MGFKDNNDPLAPRMVEASQFEEQCWTLRGQHKTYRQISEVTGKTPQAVAYALQRMVKKYGLAAKERVEDRLAIALDQLEVLANAYHAEALAGDVKKGELYLKTLERMDKLVGLDKREDAPAQVAVQVNLSGLSEERLAELSAARRQIAAIQRRTEVTEERIKEEVPEEVES